MGFSPCLPGRGEPNCQQQPRGNGSGVLFDRKLIKADRRRRAIVSRAAVAKLPDVTDSTTVLDVNDMASTFANALGQLTAKHSHPAREIDLDQRKALEVVDKAFKLEMIAELLNYTREFTSSSIVQLTRKKAQAGLYQHTKSLELEEKKGRGSSCIRSAAGELLRNRQAILQRS